MISSRGSEVTERHDFILLDSDGYFAEREERFLATIGLTFSSFTDHEDLQLLALLLIPRDVLEKATIEVDCAESNKGPMSLFILKLLYLLYLMCVARNSFKGGMQLVNEVSEKAVDGLASKLKSS